MCERVCERDVVSVWLRPNEVWGGQVDLMNCMVCARTGGTREWVALCHLGILHNDVPARLSRVVDA